MKVSVIIASRNEVPMLNITLRTALEEMSNLAGGGEVVVVDNSDPEYKEAVASVCPRGYVKEGKLQLHFQDHPSLFVAREEAARQAKGEYIVCTDAHCIFGKNSILDAVAFMRRHRMDKVGFGHMPVNWAAQHERAARHDMKVMHGTWKGLYDCERKILGKGMPWICKRDWFLNTLNGYGLLSQHRFSWGGGDMYLWLKTWMIGYENWSIPCRPVIHLGPYPKVVRGKFHEYRTYNKSGETMPYIGYVGGLIAMGGESYLFTDEVQQFLSGRFGVKVDEVYEKCQELAKDDKEWFEKHRVWTFDEMAAAQPWADTEFTTVLNALSMITDTKRSIRNDDWDLIEGVIKENDVKTVLEFGSGISTLMFERAGLAVDSLETNEDFMNKIASRSHGTVNFKLWDNDDGKVLSLCSDGVGTYKHYDFALVDGDNPRAYQLFNARRYADIIAVHDWRQQKLDTMSEWEVIAKNNRTMIFRRKDGLD